jgi:hypothetical protein
VDYVRRQREHHGVGRAVERLERIDQIEAPEGGIPSEAR